MTALQRAGLTMSDRLAILRAVLRTDLTAFIEKTFAAVQPGDTYRPNWHVEAIAWHLEQVLAGRIKRLIITLPPRYLKSIAASVAFPAFVLGRNPSAKIIAVSYAAELAAKHAADCRAVLQSPWYRAVFPETRIDPAKNTELEVRTTRRCYRLTHVDGRHPHRAGQRSHHRRRSSQGS